MSAATKTRAETAFANKSRLFVPEGARLVRKQAGLYESEDGQWSAQRARYGYGNQWTLFGPAIPGEAECDTIREAQEYVADDPMYLAAEKRATLNLAGLVADVSGWNAVYAECPELWTPPKSKKKVREGGISIDKYAHADQFISAGRTLISMAKDREGPIRQNESDMYEEKLLAGNLAAVREFIKRLSVGRNA